MPGETPPCASVNRVPAVAPRAVPVNASTWVGPERDQSHPPRRPVAGVTSSRHRTGAQRPEGSAPERGTVARQQEELRQTPTAGLDRGLRTSSTPPGPVRAACGELGQIRSGSIPSWGPSGERIILTVRPGQQGSRPQVSMAGNLGKARQHGHYHNCRASKRPLAAPPAVSLKLFTKAAIVSPSTCATAPGSGSASPTPEIASF